MKTHRTFGFRLKLDEDGICLLEATLDEYKGVYDIYSESAVELKSTNKSTIHKHAYEETRSEHPSLPSALNQCARDVALEAVKSFNSNNPDKKWGKVPSAVKTRTMRYNACCMSLRGNLLTLSTVGKRLRTLIEIPQFFYDRWLKDAVSWKCDACTVTISKKRQVIVHLCFVIEVPDVKAEGDVLGVDRGIYNVVATSDGELMHSKKIRSVKRCYAYNKKTLQQKGTRSAKRRLKAVSGREKRFVHDQNYCLSKKLANRQNVSVIVFEDLAWINGLREKKNRKSNKTMRKWLSNWSYSDLEEKTVYKCQRNGIEVKYVDPRDTSITCPVCGLVDSRSRKGNRFVCTCCSHTGHADVNAAENIRARYLANLTQAVQSGQAAVNRPGEPSGHPANGWSAAGNPVTEPAGKTLTSKPSG